MANYSVPVTPAYDPYIRKLENSDPANATDIFNPLLQKIVTNVHSLRLITDGLVALSGRDDPTAETPGAKGQRYINIATGKVFICIEIADGVYTWMADGSDASDLTFDGRPLDEVLGEMDKAISDNEVLKGADGPEAETEGAVGQLYLNTSTGELFVCTDDSDGVYIWTLVGGGMIDVLHDEVDAVTQKLSTLEDMITRNRYFAALADDGEPLTLITDEEDRALMVEWKYKEV